MSKRRDQHTNDCNEANDRSAVEMCICPEPTFSLGDDGTMDTVIVCDLCGEELRYNWDGECGHDPGEHPNEGDCYDAFIEYTLEDAATEHECENSDA